MPLLLFSPTVAQIEGITRQSILDRFLRETGLGKSGTVVTGSTTTINDTDTLLSPQFTASDWVGGWARISKDAGGASAAPENEQRSITTYDPATNGRITFSPVMTAAPVVGDSYQLWRYPDPTLVKDFLDQVLKQDIYLPCWSMLSEVPDYDMEANNTTDWAGSNATVTKVTGTEPVLLSKRWLSVAATAANGYARTATFRVQPSKRYYLSGIVMANGSGTTGELRAYDITNTASIDSKTSSNLIPSRIAFEFTTPATCYEVQIRLITQEDTKTTLWDEIVLYAIDSDSIALPWWVKNKNQVKGVFELNLNNQLASNIYDAEINGNPTNKFIVRDTAFGRGQLRLIKQNGIGINKPLFIFGIRNEVAYATDTLDSKRVDENLLFTCLAHRVFSHLSKIPNSGISDTAWIKREAVDYEKQYIKLMRQQSERLEEIIETQYASGNFIDQRFRY